MVRKCRIEDLEKLALLAYKLNNIPRTNIVFCYEKFESIKKDFKSVLESKENFIIGDFESDNLVGFISFYVIEEDKMIDVCGPFINNEKAFKEIFYQLWDFKDQFISKEFTLNFFVNSQNINTINVLEELKAVNNGNEYVMNLKIEDFLEPPISLNITKIKDYQFKELIHLQDNIFPIVYLSGEDIINTLGTLRDVYIYEIDNHIAGYCVIKRNKNTCYIEVLAVKEEFRGKHIGEQILAYTIKLESKEYDSYMLVVEKINQVAVNLYKKLGFTVKSENCSYKIQPL